MQIITTLQEIHSIGYTLLSYLPLLKKTTLLNVINFKKDSPEYLSALVLKCTLTEVEKILQKKVEAVYTKQTKIKLTDAQAVILFRTLLNMGYSSNDVYGYTVCQKWIEQLHQQIIK